MRVCEGEGGQEGRRVWAGAVSCRLSTTSPFPAGGRGRGRGGGRGMEEQEQDEGAMLGWPVAGGSLAMLHCLSPSSFTATFSHMSALAPGDGSSTLMERVWVDVLTSIQKPCWPASLGGWSWGRGTRGVARGVVA